MEASVPDSILRHACRHTGSGDPSTAATSAAALVGSTSLMLCEERQWIHKGINLVPFHHHGGHR